jgi:hypothetical protein
MPNLRDVGIGDIVIVSNGQVGRYSRSVTATVVKITKDRFRVGGVNGNYNFSRDTGIDMAHGNKGGPPSKAATAEMVEYDGAVRRSRDKLHALGVSVPSKFSLSALNAILAVIEAHSG